MSGILEQLLVLCNQLVVIGADEPKVLIAGMCIVAAVAITIVVCCVAIVCCIPYTIIVCLVQLCRWLWRRKHPAPQQRAKSASKRTSKKPEVNYIPRSKQKSSSAAPARHTSSAPVSDLPPVYPDWMNQKSGRLL